MDLLLRRPVGEKLVECHVWEDQRGDDEHAEAGASFNEVAQGQRRVPGFRHGRALYVLPALAGLELPFSPMDPVFTALTLGGDPGHGFQPDAEIQLRSSAGGIGLVEGVARDIALGQLVVEPFFCLPLRILEAVQGEFRVYFQSLLLLVSLSSMYPDLHLKQPDGGRRRSPTTGTARDDVPLGL